MGKPVHLCQIAYSVTDMARTEYWYERVFGLIPSGQPIQHGGPKMAELQSLPEAAFNLLWSMDQQDWFQFEMFEYQRPKMRLMPSDWKPSDIGYSTVGLHVVDFDAALERIQRSGGRFLTKPIGQPGNRRVCLRDPEGILLELMEDDIKLAVGADRIRPEISVVARSITLSVPDLERARRFWVGAVGLVEADGILLHGKEHEALWGLEGAERKSLLLWAGDFLVELVQYINPVGKPRSAGYLICDQGISHVAIRCEYMSSFEGIYNRAVAAGYTANQLVSPNLYSAVYFVDDQGFTVEVVCCEEAGKKAIGFVPMKRGF